MNIIYIEIKAKSHTVNIPLGSFYTSHHYAEEYEREQFYVSVLNNDDFYEVTEEEYKRVNNLVDKYIRNN